MNSKIFCRVVLIAQIVSSVFYFLPAHNTHALEPHVFLSEIAWAGSSISTSDEWLELGNPTDRDIPIGDWKILGAGSSGKPIVLPVDAFIPAGGAYLVSNYPASDASCALVIGPNVATSTLSLSNSSLLIQLFDASGQLIDQAGNGQAPPAGYSSDLKASMIRVDLLVTGELADAWKTAEVSENLATPDFGTPGQIDLKPEVDPLPLDEPTSATSTESTIIETQATTTDAAIIVPTSTEIFAELTIPETPSSTTETASSTSSVLIENPTSSSSIDVQTDQAALVFNQSDTQYLRLNEVMPDPIEGSEWIEITNTMPDRSISLESLELHDSAGKIITLKGSVTSGHLYVTVNLSSARLNNSGDSLYLKTLDGLVLDTLTYAASQKGVSWARDTQGAWRETITPTNGVENIITQKISTENESLESDDDPVIVKTTTSNPSNQTTKTEPVKSVVTKPSVSKIKPVSTATQISKPIVPKTQTAATKKTTSVAQKTSVKKSTVSKSTSSVKAPIFIDFDMLKDDTFGGYRVKLRGITGSPAGILTGRSFVLLSPDGRGLLVKVPSGQKMPTYNSALEITGTLKFDTHDFPYLTLTKNDQIIVLNQNSTSTFREITWFAPATEDAWSLVSATGTVQTISGNTISLLIDEAEIDLKIKSGVGYRPSRLKKGDLISMTGILDMTSQRPAILPRKADDIRLIEHAPASIQQVSETQKKTGLPGWTPFGAALGAIGAVEGVKKLKSRKKQKVVSVK